jgi:hypothetical protein
MAQKHRIGIAQPGLAAIAGARGDLGQAMTHQDGFFASLSTSPCARRVRRRSPAFTSRASRSRRILRTACLKRAAVGERDGEPDQR